MLGRMTLMGCVLVLIIISLETNLSRIYCSMVCPNSGAEIMNFLGLAICLGFIVEAATYVGFHLFIDIISLSFVLGGAVVFLVMKNYPENHVKNFGQRAVCFGWLGTLIGLIAITGNRFMVWGDIEKMGPALAVAMHTILYGYTIKLITLAMAND